MSISELRTNLVSYLEELELCFEVWRAHLASQIESIDHIEKTDFTTLCERLLVDAKSLNQQMLTFLDDRPDTNATDDAQRLAGVQIAIQYEHRLDELRSQLEWQLRNIGKADLHRREQRLYAVLLMQTTRQVQEASWHDDAALIATARSLSEVSRFDAARQLLRRAITLVGESILVQRVVEQTDAPLAFHVCVLDVLSEHHRQILQQQLELMLAQRLDSTG